MKFKILLKLMLLSFLLLSACGSEITIEEDDIELNNSIEPQPKISEEELFMKNLNIELTGKEVQFNMANNLDKDFYLKGTLEICDYYNYGYTNEKKFFCGKLITEDNHTWYLYFNRESFQSIYDDLLSNNIGIMVSAIIPSSAYKSNQGNMAAVKGVKVY